MPDFNPSPRDKITIAGDTYRVAAHPSVPTFAFGQEGRKAFVFQLEHTKRHKLFALKKFKPAFRYADLSDICQMLAQFAHLPGMGVCRRKCLTGPDYKGLLREFPDLEYAVLMPWMNGSTWYDLVVGKTTIDPESSLQMAWKSSLVLAELEKAGLAHCDIAGPNVIIDMDAGEVHLVDVEDMYAPGMPQPQAIPAGTDGYHHLTSGDGQWGPSADRFAGAVLLAEMLGWHDPTVRDQSDEEHYFALGDMQQDSDAYRLLVNALHDTSPNLAGLFERAWFAPTFDDCPPLSEWAAVLDPLARPSPVREWVPLVAVPAPAAPHPGNWEEPQPPPADTQPAPATPPTPATPAPASPPPEPSAPPPSPSGPSVQPPEPGGPLVGFRPIDPSSLPPLKPAPAANGEPAPIPLPPEPETAPPEARPIEPPPPSGPVATEPEPLPIEPPPEPEPAAAEPRPIEPPPPPRPVAVEPEPLPIEPPPEPEPAAAEAGPIEPPPPDEPEPVPPKAEKPTLREWLRSLRFRREAPSDVPALPPPDPPGDATPDSEEDDASTLRIAPPDTPRLSISRPDSDGSYVLTWSAVPDATYYVLQESTTMNFSGGSQATVQDATKWHVNARPPGTYYYRVRAHTDDEYGEWSNIEFVKMHPEGDESS
jgi:serine/threonine protein kinase